MNPYGMNTRDLIALLQRQDPTGEAPVLRFARGAGYESVHRVDFQVGQVVLDVKRTPQNGVGEHLAAEQYRHDFPHGRKKPVAAIVLPAVWIEKPSKQRETRT